MIGASSARASLSAHGFLREPHREVLCAAVLAPSLSLTLRDLDLLLDDLLLSLHSFTTHLNDSLTGSCLEASHRHSGLRVVCNLLIRAVTDPHTWPSIVVCACSRVSPRSEPPLPEPV